MTYPAYLYFYSEKTTFSPILHLSILCASTSFPKLYLCVNTSIYNYYQESKLLPENVDLRCIESGSIVKPILTRLKYCYKKGYLNSNCPPIELHCVNRWQYLYENKMFGESRICSIDWDTLVFASITNIFNSIGQPDLAATNLLPTSWPYILDEPIWSLCPNMLLLSMKALDLSIDYLKKFLFHPKIDQGLIHEFFCDMQPWSSVLSSAFTRKSDLSLYNLNLISRDIGAIDHNFRISSDCGTEFKTFRYYFEQGTKTYLTEPYLNAKQVLFSQEYLPFFVLDSNNTSIPELTPAAAIHFSGVEGKYILLQTFLPDIVKYLLRHLQKPDLIPTQLREALPYI